MLVLRYHLTKEEYFEFNYYTAWASPEKRGYRFRYFLRIGLLYAGVAFLYIYMNRDHDLLTDAFIFSAIAIAYFLLVPTLIRRSIRHRVNLLLKQAENQHILEEAEVQLSDAGILDRDSASESRYSWEAVVRKTETAGAWYLYTNSWHAILLPKRVVSSPADRAELQRLFDQHLSLSAQFPDT